MQSFLALFQLLAMCPEKGKNKTHTAWNNDYLGTSIKIPHIRSRGITSQNVTSNIYQLLNKSYKMTLSYFQMKRIGSYKQSGTKYLYTKHQCMSNVHQGSFLYMTKFDYKHDEWWIVSCNQRLFWSIVMPVVAWSCPCSWTCWLVNLNARACQERSRQPSGGQLGKHCQTDPLCGAMLWTLCAEKCPNKHKNTSA